MDFERKKIYDCSFCGEILNRSDSLLLSPSDGEWQGKLFISCFSCGQCKSTVEQWPAYALDPKLMLSLGSMGHPNMTLRKKCMLVYPEHRWADVSPERLLLTLGELMMKAENIGLTFPRVAFTTYHPDLSGVTKDGGKEFTDLSERWT